MEGLNLEVPIRAADADDCNYYYDCTIGASTRQQSTAGQCFDGELYGYCEDCEDVNCGFRGLSE